MNDVPRENYPAKKLIKNFELVNDTWCYGESDGASSCSRIVTQKQWQQEREALMQKSGAIGVKLSGETDLFDSGLLPYLSRINLIAIEFTAFTDGRGFSLAVQLRQYGFHGELRAMGSILLDQLHYLLRCGFDAFEIAPDMDVDLALSALGAFSESYQPGW